MSANLDCPPSVSLPSSYDGDSMSEDFVIRPLKLADIPQICKLHEDLLQYPYSASFFRQFLLHSMRLCLVAHPLSAPDTPIAFVSASIYNRTVDLARNPRKPFEVPQVQILTLGVQPSYRRRGIARRLVLTAVQKLQETAKHSPVLSAVLSGGTEVMVHVATSNEGGRNFYEALGMESENNLVKDLYRSPSPHLRDAFVLIGKIH